MTTYHYESAVGLRCTIDYPPELVAPERIVIGGYANNPVAYRLVESEPKREKINEMRSVYETKDKRPITVDTKIFYPEGASFGDVIAALTKAVDKVLADVGNKSMPNDEQEP